MLEKVIKYINTLGTLNICGVKFFVVKNMNGKESLRIDELYTSSYSGNQTGSIVNEIKYSIDDSKLYVKCFFRGKAYFMNPFAFSMEDRDKEIIQNIQKYTDEDYTTLTKGNISYNPSDSRNH